MEPEAVLVTDSEAFVIGPDGVGCWFGFPGEPVPVVDDDTEEPQPARSAVAAAASVLWIACRRVKGSLGAQLFSIADILLFQSFEMHDLPGMKASGTGRNTGRDCSTWNKYMD